MVYIPRFSYPVIPLAKKHDKKVIVHLHNYQPLTYCAVVFHSYNGNHNVNVLHDVKESLRFEIRENESSRKALLSSVATPLNRLSRAWVALADVVICVSKRQAEIVKRQAPHLAKKVKVIYNPLPDVRFKDKAVKESSFLYVGGSSFCKGVHVLAEASTKFLKQNKCRFLLTNMTSNRWQLFFKELNHSFNGSFSIFDRLSYESLLNVHSEVTALLFPSIWEEPLPYSILEAMLAGTIPIASKTGGIPEIVQGTFAEKMLFSPNNAEELVERMESLMPFSNEQLNDVGQHLREETQRRFSVKKTTKGLTRVFSSSI